jgi:EAL and modified HD-GYP domain-containing signal transduction protein
MEASTTVFVGRQPIFDRRLEVFGYELLFRRGHVGAANVTDGEQATAQVIINTFMEIGLEQIVADRLAFLNFTRSLLCGRRWMLLPKERVIIEVLEDVSADPEVLAVLYAIAAQGYAIALDDFVCQGERHALAELAHIIKFDVRALQGQALAEQVEMVRRPGLKLLAEKVETEEEYAFCRELGFDYFQGYYFSKPQVLEGQRLPPDRVGTLRLLFELQDPEISVSRLEHLIRLDLSLSYKILRYINSAFVALPRRISAIREAVILLGLDRVRMWASLIAMAGLQVGPRESLVTAMIRARMCEDLATERGAEEPDRYFTVGLLSMLDVLVGQPLPELLTMLPLAAEVADALLSNKGPMGEVLTCVIHYERAEWDKVRLKGVSPGFIRQSYLQSVRWATAMGRDIFGL